jgi:hypothetical protein
VRQGRIKLSEEDTPPLPVRDEASQGSTALGRMAEREGIHADTLPRPVIKAPQLQVGWPSEKGFMQTRFHGHSVTKLVRAPQL